MTRIHTAHPAGNVIPGTRTLLTGAPPLAAHRPSLAGRHVHVQAAPTTVFVDPYPTVIPTPVHFVRQPQVFATTTPIYGSRTRAYSSSDARVLFGWAVVVMAIIFTFGLALIAHESMFRWANGR